MQSADSTGRHTHGNPPFQVDPDRGHQRGRFLPVCALPGFSGPMQMPRSPFLIQCDGCLSHFRRDEVVKKCDCGAFLCFSCDAAGVVAACYCDC